MNIGLRNVFLGLILQDEDASLYVMENTGIWVFKSVVKRGARKPHEKSWGFLLFYPNQFSISIRERNQLLYLLCGGIIRNTLSKDC